MARRHVVAILSVLSLTAALAAAQNGGAPPLLTPWGHPNLQGIWTNATLTPLQRPADLAGEGFFSVEEAAAFERQRVAQTNADRPLQDGDVGSYNDAFFERGTSIVKTRRTSLVIAPRDGRIPSLTPAAQQRVAVRDAYMAAHRAEERAAQPAR
jgi:hypothetical protein